MKFDLQTQLIDAQKNLERILDESETAARAQRVVEAEVSDLESKVNSVDDVLAGLKPKPSTIELDQARSRADQAREVCRIYARATEEARHRVESARSAIEFHQLEIDRAAFAEELKRWDAASETFLKAHQAIHDKLLQLDRPVNLTDIFFPALNLGAMDSAKANERLALIALYNSGSSLLRLKLSGLKGSYSRRDEVAA